MLFLFCETRQSTNQHPADNNNSCQTLVHVACWVMASSVIVRKGQLLQIIKLSKCPTPDAHEEEADNFSASHFLSSECNYKMTVNRNSEGQDEVWKITFVRSAHRIRGKTRPPFDCKQPPVEHWSATNRSCMEGNQLKKQKLSFILITEFCFRSLRKNIQTRLVHLRNLCKTRLCGCNEQMCVWSKAEKFIIENRLTD